MWSSYEALKGTVSDEAARLIAEVIPPAENLATRVDIQLVEAGLRSEIAEVRSEIRNVEARLGGQIHAETTRTIKWMLGFSIPVWAGTWGIIATILLKG